MSNTKSAEIARRQIDILRVLAALQSGQAGYTLLQQALARSDQGFSERTVRNDCRDLMDRGLVRKIRNGVAITGLGSEMLKLGDAPEEGLKVKYLKQMCLLRLLYHKEKETCLVKGLSTRELAQYEGIGSEDAVKEMLQTMAGEGLVFQDGQRWRLGQLFPRPVPVRAEEADRLYEYLTVSSEIAPLTPELALLKSKLVPLLMMNGRDRWRDKLVKMVDRIIVHGRETAEDQQITDLIRNFEQAVCSRQVVRINYRGRLLKINPIGVIYHWTKGKWYVIAQNPDSDAVIELRVDRMSDFVFTKETYTLPEKFDLQEFMSGRWGISSGGEISVQVRFRNTAWHVVALDKLQGELSRRQVNYSHCKLTKRADGSMILADRIKGVNEFAAWLRSYGDAAEVLESSPLRRKMYETSRRMLARYGVEGSENES